MNCSPICDKMAMFAVRFSDVVSWLISHSFVSVSFSSSISLDFSFRETYSSEELSSWVLFTSLMSSTSSVDTCSPLPAAVVWSALFSCPEPEIGFSLSFFSSLTLKSTPEVFLSWSVNEDLTEVSSASELVVSILGSLSLIIFSGSVISIFTSEMVSILTSEMVSILTSGNTLSGSLHISWSDSLLLSCSCLFSWSSLIASFTSISACCWVVLSSVSLDFSSVILHIPLVRASVFRIMSVVSCLLKSFVSTWGEASTSSYSFLSIWSSESGDICSFWSTLTNTTSLSRTASTEVWDLSSADESFWSSSFASLPSKISASFSEISDSLSLTSSFNLRSSTVTFDSLISRLFLSLASSSVFLSSDSFSFISSGFTIFVSSPLISSSGKYPFFSSFSGFSISLLGLTTSFDLLIIFSVGIFSWGLSSVLSFPL